MDTADVNSYIGERIRDLRNRNGLTQQELADRTELTKGFISQLERGQVSASVVTLFDLIECLGTTPAEFFRNEDEKVVFSENEYFEKIDEEGNSIQWIVPTGSPLISFRSSLALIVLSSVATVSSGRASSSIVCLYGADALSFCRKISIVSFITD